MAKEKTCKNEKNVTEKLLSTVHDYTMAEK